MPVQLYQVCTPGPVGSCLRVQRPFLTETGQGFGANPALQFDDVELDRLHAYSRCCD